MLKRMLLPLLVLCLLAGAACAASFSDDPAAINEAALSVVKLEIYDSNRQLMATGSGFVAFDSRHLVTNYHVIEDSGEVVAYNDNGERYVLKGVTIADKDKDIAILEFYSPTDLAPLKLNESGEVLRASKVVAIGSPKGYKNTVSTGVISNAFEEDGVKMIQITAPISHGSSGGALFDDAGVVIGVTSSSNTEGQNLNFAINIVEVIDLYETWNQSETTLTQAGSPTLASALGNNGFTMSTFTEYPKIFTITERKEDDLVFIDTTTESRDEAFVHRYESDSYYSLIYPDIIVLNYSDTSGQFPVLRVWICYRGTKEMNFRSAEFILPGGDTFTVSDISEPDRVYLKDDGSYAEDLLVRFGTNNFPLFKELATAAIRYANDQYGDDGDRSAPPPAIRLVLHGNEDLEVNLPSVFWADLGLFCVTLPEDLDTSFITRNEGNPCIENLWGI